MAGLPDSTVVRSVCKLANEICVLSPEEAGRLENWGIWPLCKAHKHIKRREAADGAKAGLLRYVGGEDTEAHGATSMVVASGEVAMWQPVPCRDLNGREILGLRVWGNAPAR
jgi:hypothetical protein